MITLKNFHTYQEVVICQGDGDMGDSPQRTAFFHVAKVYLGEANKLDCIDFEEAFQIWTPKGRLIRDPIKWNIPEDISRDQQDPVVCALACYEMYKPMEKIICEHWVRFPWAPLIAAKYPNRDWAHPGNIAMELRALHAWWMWPYFWVGDFLMALGAAIDCINVYWHQGSDGPWLDMDNAITRHAFAQMFYPTPMSWLARKIHIWFYPKNYGNEVTGEELPLMGALANKHQGENNNPAFIELWRPIISHWYGSPLVLAEV